METVYEEAGGRLPWRLCVGRELCIWVLEVKYGGGDVYCFIFGTAAVGEEPRKDEYHLGIL